MEIFWTVVSGTSIYVLGQVVQTFFIKPINDFKITLGEISHKVKFHSNIITNSGVSEDRIVWSSGDMRDLSCQLESKYLAIPWSYFFSILGLLIKREDVRESSVLLIRLSNSTGMKGDEIINSETIDKLKKRLKLIL
ncbi:hypothetical protein HYU91_03055 [Candidatus Collierbacteria bacterium]|nr:hypothetical protein [Candidatus Collierbacteria bacterium]